MPHAVKKPSEDSSMSCWWHTKRFPESMLGSDRWGRVAFTRHRVRRETCWFICTLNIISLDPFVFLHLEFCTQRCVIKSGTEVVNLMIFNNCLCRYGFLVDDFHITIEYSQKNCHQYIEISQFTCCGNWDLFGKWQKLVISIYVQNLVALQQIIQSSYWYQ